MHLISMHRHGSVTRKLFDTVHAWMIILQGRYRDYLNFSVGCEWLGSAELRSVWLA